MIEPKEYQDSEIPVSTDDTNVREAINKAQQQNLKHIIAVDKENRLLGIINISEINDNLLDKTIKDLPKELFKPYYIFSSQHLYEALAMMYNYSLEFVPVIDEENKLLGILDRSRMFEILIRLTKAHAPGSTIILHVPKNSYSLTHIASIIENEGAKIISVFSQYNEEEEIYLVSIKISAEDPSRIIASLERMGYNVYYYTASDVQPIMDLQERVNALLKFLNP